MASSKSATKSKTRPASAKSAPAAKAPAKSKAKPAAKATAKAPSPPKPPAPPTGKVAAAATSPSRGASTAPTKQDKVLAMLRSAAGATIEAIMAATDWQAHTVRGFFAGTIRKRLKLELSSETVDGKRVYRIGKAAGER